MKAGVLRSSYGLGTGTYVVVDHEGVLRTRLRGIVRTDDIRRAIRAAIDEIPVNTAVAEEADSLPDRTTLGHNFPNPFNASTTVRFSLRTESSISLGIYNQAGQLIRELKSARLGPGVYAEKWDGRDSHGNDASSGVYLYQLVTEDQAVTRKMLLLR